MRTAIVHEWFTTYAGSERVVEQMLEMFPAADLHALVDFLPEADRGFLGGRPVRTSFLQRMPFARGRFRHYLPLMPSAVEQFDLSAYDVVLSSNHAVAKGAILGPDQLHVSYVHSPVRYAWDLQHQYLREAGLTRGLKGLFARGILHYLRQWDQSAANRVDAFVANSRYIARRIWRTYRREAEVVHPPVDVDAIAPGDGRREPYYLAAGRLVPYKRADLLVDAFALMPDRKLVVIGDGTEMEKLKKRAGPNVDLIGYQQTPAMREHLRRARAYLFAAEEDFGIAPVEAMAAGTPVIAFGRGGATETVQDGRTGLFFEEQTPEAVAEAVRRFERLEDRFDPTEIRGGAERFRPERFRRELSAVVEREWERHQSKIGQRPVASRGTPRWAEPREQPELSVS
ncbi:MAG TPA: glycosyltransferase family 4 protein [Humisphaera sp.]